MRKTMGLGDAAASQGGEALPYLEHLAPWPDWLVALRLIIP